MAPLAEQSTTFESLPFELKLDVLAALPDIQSLISVSQVCRELRAAFKHSRDSLIRAVLLNCIGYDTLPEATIVHRCKAPTLSTLVEGRPELDHDEVANLSSFVTRFMGQLERPAVSSLVWTMEEAFDMVDFHLQVVSPFVERFVLYCSTTMDVKLRESLASAAPSREETGRIARAFYRFELYRKLYGCFHFHFDAFLASSFLFFLRFAPWENAQLSCIHDYLISEVLPGKPEAGWNKHNCLVN